jgi:hypothetical protein
VWTTTTQELADRVLKDDETFTLRRDDGSIAGSAACGCGRETASCPLLAAANLDPQANAQPEKLAVAG